jgi:hypothetical protein
MSQIEFLLPTPKRKFDLPLLSATAQKPTFRNTPEVEIPASPERKVLLERSRALDQDGFVIDDWSKVDEIKPPHGGSFASF